MTYILIAILSIFIGFISGMLFERNNAKKVDKVITDAKMLKERGKVLLDALKGR